MKNKNLQGGFAPFLIIAIVAILAIGGGAYVVVKNKEVKKAQIESNINAEVNADANVNVNAKGSLRSLLALGKDSMCTFSSTAEGVTYSGTVYISTDGGMRGDFTSEAGAYTRTSSMIVKGETSYMWTGSQGTKMNMKTDYTTASSNANVSAKSNVDLDSQVDYKCENWSKDESKFVVPASVKFLDLEAMMKSSGGVDINALLKAQGQ